MFDWEGRAEGLVNVKYLKIINKTFPPDDKDPTASTLKLGLVRMKMIPYDSGRLVLRDFKVPIHQMMKKTAMINKTRA